MKHTNVSIDLNQFLADSNDEIELLPYLVKLELQNNKIPIIIDPTNVRDPDFVVETGELSYTIDAGTLVMNFEYREIDHARAA